MPVLAATFLGLTIAALAAPQHGLAAVLPMVALWGLSGWSFFPPQQARLVGLVGPAHTPVVLSLNASFMYFGFSVGAALGYVVITQSSVAWIGAAGAACIICAMLVSAIAWRHRG